MAQLVKNLPKKKKSACNVKDLGSIPWLESSPGEGNGNPLQYSGLENSVDCIVHRVTKSRTRLSDFHFTSGELRGFPGGSDGRESTCNSGHLSLIPGLRRSPGGGLGNPFQYSCLENPHEQKSLVGYSLRESQRARHDWAPKHSTA